MLEMEKNTREEIYNKTKKSVIYKYSTCTDLSKIIDNGVYDFIFKKIYDSFENKSCDSCIHKDAKDKNELIDYSCLECSRYYTDKFKNDVKTKNIQI